jgi:Fic-DOC domain mobile mystery protein B
LTLKLEFPNGSTPLDLNEIEGLKHPNIKTQAQLNALEAANILEGLQWLARLRNPDPFNDAFASLLHKKMFGQVWKWAGTFRKTGKNIGVDPIYIPVQLRQLLDDVRYWHAQKTYHPIEAAVRFHHQLTVIHPFPNGNGRHARIYAETILNKMDKSLKLKWGLNVIETNSDRTRSEYISSLKAADSGNYDALLNFVGYNF